jgi:hypothetical protein
MSINNLDFTGNVPLITEAARGMGLAAEKAFAEAGASEAAIHFGQPATSRRRRRNRIGELKNSIQTRKCILSC